MSLPWFSFNKKAFISDTMRLNTEGKGAYLMLMLDYYEQEVPPPDDDEVLATITGLSVEAWKRHRRVIAPLFEIKDGLWRHERIETEIAEACSKHAQSIARAKHAAEVRHGKKQPKDAPSMPVASPKHAPSKKNAPGNASSTAPGMPQAIVKQFSGDAHKQVHIEDDDKDAGARGREMPRSVFSGVETDPQSIAEIEDALTGTQPVSMGVPIELWERPFVAANHIPIFQRFFNEHAERGTFSRDWPSLWQAYLDAATARRKAPPRVETDKRPEPIPGVRVLISDEAFAVAKRAAELIDVTDHPVTVGMPALMQTWMASWPPDVILTSIERVMARRRANGETGPPGTMKYFENAIAREFAESKRPLPVAVAAPRKEITTHGQRTESKSLSGAADRLIARIAAGDGGGTDDGRHQGQAVAGAISEE